MPRYTYKCSACGEIFEINHGMFHQQRECIVCKRIETIEKIPDFSIRKEQNQQSPKRVGKVVDEFILEAKKELKEQKSAAAKEKIGE